jgi:hypothetical protein
MCSMCMTWTGGRYLQVKTTPPLVNVFSYSLIVYVYDVDRWEVPSTTTTGHIILIY